MGQSGSKLLARGSAKGSGMRLPRTSQPPPVKTREEMLGEDSGQEDDQLSANLKRFLNPRQHTTMTGMAPAADNTNVQALRRRMAGDAQSRLESQQISKLLRDLGQGLAVETVARDYKLDAATARALQTFLTPVS